MNNIEQTRANIAIAGMEIKELVLEALEGFGADRERTITPIIARVNRLVSMALFNIRR